MFPTPDFSHLARADYENVYEPAEDSFLLLDALEKDMNIIHKIRPLICLEVGSGSGIASTFLAKLIGNSATYFATDLNARATDVTRRTAEQNHVHILPVVMDLAGGLLHRLQNKVDVLIFNPPYVVTPPEEVGSHGIEASWAGGLKGREVLDRFFPQVPLLLSETGLFYLVIIKENDKSEIEHIMQSSGFRMATVLVRKSGPENLEILRFSRHSPEGAG